MSIDQLESGVAAMTRVANRLYEWAGSAALKLNASKTNAIISGYREFGRIPHDLPRIEVSGIPVPYVETAENLGVTIDSKFTWKPQVDRNKNKDVSTLLYSTLLSLSLSLSLSGGKLNYTHFNCSSN